jgi:cytoskeletal protein CcmA (bactofilin family)
MEKTVNPNDVDRISAGAKFVGDFATKHDIRIDGTFEGRLFSEAHVVIGEKAVIKGEIYSTSADIYGSLTDSDIYVKDTLSLKPGSSVRGNLFFQRVQVDLEAKITGQCKIVKAEEFDKESAPVRALLK